MSTCRCCDGLSVETPAAIANRPGQRAIAYRSGTHAQFLATLLARLSSARLPDGRAPLLALTTRDDDDYTIALLDGFACVCDVLTFYQERIANEHYLRTARELFSVTELARLIDYRLRPGVAAATDIAFTVEEAPGALGQALGIATTAQVAPSPPLRTVVDVGTKVQSVPGPGEEPQTFETVRRIVARPGWNALRPLLRQAQHVHPRMDSLFLRGTSTNLKPGDPVLIAAGEDRGVRRVRQVTTDDEARTTRVDFVDSPGDLRVYRRPTDLPLADPEEFQAKRPLTKQLVERKIFGHTWNMADLEAVIAAQGWSRHLLATFVNGQLSRDLKTPDGRAFALRQRAAVFGHNAPQYKSLPRSLRFDEKLQKAGGKTFVEQAAYGQNWEVLRLSADTDKKGHVYLDNVYSSIQPDSWAALQAPGSDGIFTQVFRITENVEMSRSDYTLTARVSRLTVERVLPDHARLSNFPIRTTSVLAQSERLVPAGSPIPNPVQHNVIVLDSFHLGLEIGQRVVVTGEREDLEGTVTSEARTLKEVTVEDGLTVLTLERGLENAYKRDTVQINANVAPATHGESMQEVLGSGSGSQPFQSYELRGAKKPLPLTYVGAANETGAASTLEVRVNDLLWHERHLLFGSGPRERIYMTRTDVDGRTTVVFGDGRTGARLPSGSENVRASYRRGSGAAGNLEAHRLTQLLTRPLGLKGATNPLPATGGVDPERLRDARRNAPLTVLTLGRVVSLQDYEDFARAFAGIAKALATWTWNGSARGVFLTVAGEEGAEVEPNSRLAAHLVRALGRAGDPAVPLRVATYRPRFFRVAGSLRIERDRDPEDVLRRVIRRLRSEFSFEARDFGQPVTRSEVIAVMHEVPGVVAVDLDELHRARKKEGLREVLAAHAPPPGAANPLGAELLTLDPRPVRLTVIE